LNITPIRRLGEWSCIPRIPNVSINWRFVIRFIPRTLCPELKRLRTGGRWVRAIVGLEAVEKKEISLYVGSVTSDFLADHPVFWSVLSHYVSWGVQRVGDSLSRRRTFEGGMFEIFYN
jgi:hypothetical protein